MRQKFLLIITLLIAFCGFAKADDKEAYAVYYYGTLTFYYDANRNIREGDVYDMNTGTNTPGWYDEHSADITHVNFTTSFSAARPTSTYAWFASGEDYESTSQLISIEGIKNLNTNEVTEMSYMFWHCSLLTDLDVSGFNTAKVTNMHYMFYNCSNLTSLDVSGFNTAKVTNMGYMFYNCSSLTSLDVSGFKTSEVTDMGCMFYNCSSLKDLDTKGFDTHNVKYMDWMFYWCSGLTNLDVSGFDTHNVEYMNWMFSFCNSLTNLDVSSFSTTKVKDMRGMFDNCNELTIINVSGFDTQNVENMAYMFSHCYKVTSIDVSGFNTEKVTSMWSMFQVCSSLKNLDLSNFNTSSVTTMPNMFFNCSNLTSLDLSSFDTGNVTEMERMFQGCISLETIYVGDAWTTVNVTSGDQMFLYCIKLAGGKGTAFDSDHTDSSYARIDGGASTPGYMTNISQLKYDLLIGGTLVTGLNRKSLPVTSGTASYNPFTNTLTLNNATISNTDYNTTGTTNGYGIYSNIDGLTINVVGDDNTVTSENWTGIFSMKNLTFAGTGSLNIVADNGTALSMGTNGYQLNVTGGVKVYAKGMYGIEGGVGRATVGGESVIVSYNTTLNISNKDTELHAYGTEQCVSTLAFLGDGIEYICEDNESLKLYFEKNAICFYERRNFYPYSNGWIVLQNPNLIATGLEAAPQIDNGQLTIDNSSDSWFTIDGRKLSGKPAKKGIYIHNGKAVVH